MFRRNGDIVEKRGGDIDEGTLYLKIIELLRFGSEIRS